MKTMYWQIQWRLMEQIIHCSVIKSASSREEYPPVDKISSKIRHTLRFCFAIVVRIVFKSHRGRTTVHNPPKSRREFGGKNLRKETGSIAISFAF